MAKKTKANQIKINQLITRHLGFSSRNEMQKTTVEMTTKG